MRPRLLQAHQDPRSSVPPVVHFDGMWLRVQIPTGTEKRDKRQRKRKGHKGKKVVLLVALGFWTDGSRVILDWEVADGESQAVWERLVHRVWERGVRPEKGLQAVASRWQWGGGGSVGLGLWGQHCRATLHFSHVRPCGRHVPRGTESEDAHKQTRTQLLEEARTIYQAERAQEARTRLATKASTWGVRTRHPGGDPPTRL